MKIIRIHFMDGSFHVFKDIIEYVSGIHYFFIVQNSNSHTKNYAFNRNEICYIERKTYNKVWKIVKLKKIINA